MSLRKLIVVRHGLYDETTGSLTEKGQRQIAELARVLSGHLNGQRACILSSSAKRAKQTSAILSTCLGGLESGEFECLYSGGGALDEDDANEALGLIADKSENYDVVILSTHLEYIEKFPTFYGKTRGLQIGRTGSGSKGTACVIDVETGHAEEVHPGI